MTEDEMELLPCPFCNSTAHFIKRPEKMLVSIFCENPSCGAEIAKFISSSANDKIQDIVINNLAKAWNRRTL